MERLTVVSIEPRDSVKDYSEKQLVRSYHVIVRDGDYLKNVITCRFYSGLSTSSNTVYCSLWYYSKSYNGSGSGSASGYGYDKFSSALSQALTDSGVTLSYDISGTGIISEALEALATFMGYSNLITVS